MWILKSVAGGGDAKEPTVVHWFITYRTYSVGRKDCDVVLQDKSISRKHAEILVEKSHAKSERPRLYFRDLSKFGSYFNNKKLSTKEPILMEEGSTLRFAKDFEFVVGWLPLVFCFSNVVRKEKANVEALVSRIAGATITEEWKACTHLAMPEISLTPKCLLSLVDQKAIVGITWLEALVAHASCDPIPCDKYPPVIPEQFEGVSLSPSTKRSTLLKGRVFVFLTQQQLDKASEIVECAGGTTELVNPEHLMTYLGELSPSSLKSVVIVNPMSFDDEDSSQDANEPLLEQLDKVGVTRANEEEIGIAILQADASKLLPFARNVRLPSPSVLKPIAPTSHKAANPNAAIRMDVPPSPPTPKQQSITTSPPRSQPAASKFKVKPDIVPGPPRVSPPRLPQRGELLFQSKKSSTPVAPIASQPKLEDPQMVVLEAPLITRAANEPAGKRFKKNLDLPSNNAAVSLKINTDKDESKQSWLEKAALEARRKEEADRTGDELFNSKASNMKQVARKRHFY